MIRNFPQNLTILLLLLTLFSGCTQTNKSQTLPTLTALDIDKIESVPEAREFARLCLAENKSITELVGFALSDGWIESSESELAKFGLSQLRRTILEIPGGGAQYRETQTILQFSSKSERYIANLMERYKRGGSLIRTQCTLYSLSNEYVPICAAIGKLLARPPDSNQRFKHSGKHFIRWNVGVAGRRANVRCEGQQSEYQPNSDNPLAPFSGTRISMIVDQTSTEVAEKHSGEPLIKENYR